MSQRRLEVVFEVESGQTVAKLRQIGDSFRAVNSSVQAASRGIAGAGSSFDAMGRSVHGPLQTLRDYVLVLGNIRQAFLFVKDVAITWVGALLDQAAKVERLTILMKGLSTQTTELGKNKEAQQNLSDLYDMAKKTGFAVGDLADAFVKFKSAKLNPSDGSLQALSDAVASFGGTSQTMHRASIAIQQMAGKGVISMEELRQQLGEAVPTAINTMASAMGKSVPELAKMIKTGTVAAGPALKLMFDEMARLYSGAGARLADSFTGQLSAIKTNIMQISTDFTGLANGQSAGWLAYVEHQKNLLNQGKITQDQFNETTKVQAGLFKVAVDGMKDLNRAMEGSEGREVMHSFGEAVAAVAGALVAGVKVAVDWRQEIGFAINSVIIPGLIGLMALKFGNFLLAQAVVAGSALSGLRGQFATLKDQAQQFYSLATGTIKAPEVAALSSAAANSGRAAAEATATANSSRLKAAALSQELIALRALDAEYVIHVERLFQADLMAQRTLATGRATGSFRNLETGAFIGETAAVNGATEARARYNAALILSATATRNVTATTALLAAAEAEVTVATTAAAVATSQQVAANAANTLSMRLMAGAAAMGTAAMGFLRTAMSLALGPIGLVGLALYTAASYAGWFTNKANEATAAAARLMQGIADLEAMKGVAARQASLQAEKAGIQENERFNARESSIWGEPMMGKASRKINSDRIAAIDVELTRNAKALNRGQISREIDNANQEVSVVKQSTLRIQAARSAAFKRAQDQLDQQGAANNDPRRFALRRKFDNGTKAMDAASIASLEKDAARFRAAGNSSAESTVNLMLYNMRGPVEQFGQIADMAQTSAGKVGGAAGSGGGPAGMNRSIAALARGAGAVAQLEDKLKGGHGALTKFNAELAGGKYPGASAQWVAQRRSQEARIDALHESLGGDKGKSASEMFQSRLQSAAGKVAALAAELEDGVPAIARFNAEMAAGRFKGITQADIDRYREYLKLIDIGEKNKKTKGITDGLDADITEQVEELKALHAAYQVALADPGLFQQALADAKIKGKYAKLTFDLNEELKTADPGRVEEINAQIQSITAKVNELSEASAAVDMAKIIADWDVAAAEINRSLLPENDQRKANFDEEMRRQEALVAKTKEGTESRKRAEESLARYRTAAATKLARENESSVVKMARGWAMLGQNMDQALGGALDNFVNGLVEGNLNFAKFAKSMIKDLIKIILKAMIAYAILSALGMANNSSGGKVGFGDFLKGQVGGAFGGSTSNSNIGFGKGSSTTTGADDGDYVYKGLPGGSSGGGFNGGYGAGLPSASVNPVGSYHRGGMIGSSRDIMNVSASLFAKAPSYHNGGMIGARPLKPGEVPLIGLKGEQVLTEEQQRQAAQGRGVAATSVQVNIINNSGTALDAEHGSPEFNGRDMILNVVVEAASKTGPFRDALKGISNG
jgi:tape measure domain-containing protein